MQLHHNRTVGKRVHTMLTNEQVEQHLKESGSFEIVRVSGDGYHYQITLVSEIFKTQSRVARQQWVYALLNEYITAGSLHALTMHTWTPDEWGSAHG
jgi:acid stress-induced BolA-like protein IbaG/YrbA